MPTYGYHCPSCDTDFEVFQRMIDEAIAACPSCGARARRLFFPAGIVFKGSGFYKTDSRSAKATPAAGSSKSETAGASNGKAGEGSSAGSAAATDTTPSTEKKAATGSSG
jgi:putative FmdB family regulatory protein